VRRGRQHGVVSMSAGSRQRLVGHGWGYRANDQASKYARLVRYLGHDRLPRSYAHIPTPRLGTGRKHRRAGGGC
jgi:hypothetical protein